MKRNTATSVVITCNKSSQQLSHKSPSVSLINVPRGRERQWAVPKYWRSTAISAHDTNGIFYRVFQMESRWRKRFSFVESPVDL